MESGKPLQPKSGKPEAALAPAQKGQAGQSVPAKISKSLLEVEEQLAAANPRDRGFDPYNSGVFNARDTWSRVNRKK